MRARLILALALASQMASAGAEAQSLALSEVWLGEGPFIEIVNDGDAEVSTAGVYLATSPDAALLPAGSTAALALGDHTIAPGGYAVIDIGDGARVEAGEAIAALRLAPDTAAGMAWLLHWDGASDLVEDLDVVRWGDGAPALDRGQVAVDGPDDDSDASSYLEDTPAEAQSAAPALVLRGIVRLGADEVATSPGNGVDGTDETSEDAATAWAATGTPTPGAANVEGRFAVYGRVVREGAAIAGAAVTLRAGDEVREATSTASGFRFGDLEADFGAFELTIVLGDVTVEQSGVIVDANAEFVVDTSPPAPLVVDLALVARTLPDATVTVEVSGPAALRGTAPAGTPVTLAGLIAGRYDVSASAPGFDTVTASVDVMGETELLLTSYPSASITVTGTALTERGTDANGALVRLDGEGYRAGVVRTATVSAGAFSVADVPPGYYRLRVTVGAETADLRHVDLLATSALSLRLSSAERDPEFTTTGGCATVAASQGAWALPALIGLALAIRRRRRPC